MSVYYIDSNHRARSEMFDQVQACTRDVLDLPDVQEQLGGLGRSLQHLNEHAILPNVTNDGRVVVPPEYRDSSEVCIVPRLTNDPALKPDQSFLQPTPNRLEKVRLALGDAVGLDVYVQAAVLATQGKQETLSFNGPVIGGALGHYDENRGILVTGRPFVVLNQDWLPESRVGQGLINAYGLTLAYDAERLLGEPDDYAKVAATLRACRVGAVIGEAAMLDGIYRPVQLEREAGFIDGVEDNRREHSIDPYALLGDGFALDRTNQTHQHLVARMRFSANDC